jgi:hypothetical protein
MAAIVSVATVACDLRQPTAPPATVVCPSPPAATKAEGEAGMKGRFQIVHTAPWVMVLLDTVTGDAWMACPRGDLKAGGPPSAWCEMIKGEFAVPAPKSSH